MNEQTDHVSEDSPHYGKRRRMARKPIIITEEEMKKMPPPFPVDPGWMAELEAEADKRERERAVEK